MKFLFLILFALTISASNVIAQNIPFRPESDYEINLDYDFRVKSMPDQDVLNFVEEQNATPLPHLTIYVSILNKKEEEVRLKIMDNKSKTRYSGKIKEKPVKLVLGFTDDMKDGVTGSKFTITISTKKRIAINKIVLEVLPDGTYLINGKVNGKL